MSLELLSLADHGPVIPVIVIEDEHHAVPMARALLKGGVRVLEVTLRTAAAMAAMRAISREVPEAVLGAGTLRTPADVEAALEAGCQFGVSPGFTPALAKACREMGLPLLPGVSSASEVMRAADEGLNFLKFFPAVPAGGVQMLKALGGPFPDIQFCPTGGITARTAPEFLGLRNVSVCGGSWLTPAEALASGDWGAITALAEQASGLRRSG